MWCRRWKASNGGQDDAVPVPAAWKAETVSRHAASLVAVAIGRNTVTMVEIAQKIIFYVVLTDRDRWAVEVEWPDGTLERVDTFGEHSLATYWVATQSQAWLEVRRIFGE
jgi:hypothetical protein